MGGVNNLLDYWKTFSAIAVEQPLVPATAQKKIEFPDEIPNIVEPSIHPLPTKWAMNVRRITSDEEPSDAQMRDVPVMDAEVAAPVKSARLNLTWRPLTEYRLHEFQRRSVPFRFIDRGHDAPASGAHRKDRHWSELTWTQLQFLCRQSVVRFDVGE